MKRIALLIMVALIASATAMAAKKSSGHKPEGARIVLKAAADFNSVVLNAPVTVELVKDAKHPGYVVYHSTVKGELKVYNKGSELVISVKDEFKNKRLGVTSRVVVCYDGDFNSLVVNGSGDILAKSLRAGGDARYVVNGSGDIKVADVETKGVFKCVVNGSGDIDLCSLKATGLSATVNGSGDVELKTCAVSGSADLAVNGSGDLDVNDIKASSVSAKVSGSGDLVVKGSAVDANLAMAGSGDLSAGALQAENTRVSGTGSGDISCRASRSLYVKGGKACDIKVRGPRPAQVEIHSDNVEFTGK